MRKISAAIITLNEEEKIGAALESLRGIADEIVVVDSHSSDGTEEICRRFTDRFLQETWRGYRRQKQFATDCASFDWVLSLDADEALSRELRREMMEWKQSPEEPKDGYCMPRKTFFLGRWIEHTTWHPDWQLRLFRKSRGCWRGGRIHEAVAVTGSVGRFQSTLEHYTYSSISEYLRQLERFSALAAADYHDAGRRVGYFQLALHPPLTFFHNFIIRGGFLDGLPGLAVSALSATSVLFKYLKLWEIQTGLVAAPKSDPAEAAPAEQERRRLSRNDPPARFHEDPR